MKLASLFTEIGIDSRPFDAGLATVHHKLERERGALSRLANFQFNISGLQALGAGIGIGGIVAGLNHAVNAASDLNETANKLGVIFGGDARVVSAAADQMAAKFGVVKSEFMDSAAEIGQLLQGMGGMSAKGAAEISVKLARAAADASSIYNKSFAESIGKIGSALRGQSEPLSSFGVDVQEAAVKAEALRMGLSRGSQELSTQAKVAARTSVILRGLKITSGDLANTSKEYANASRAAAGRIENLSATIGMQLLPAYKEMKALINDVLIDFTEGHDGMKSKLASFAGFLTSTVETIGTVYRNWGLIIQRTGVMLGGWAANVGEVFAWLPGAIGQFGTWFVTNWRTIFTDAYAIMLRLTQNAIDMWRDNWLSVVKLVSRVILNPGSIGLELGVGKGAGQETDLMKQLKQLGDISGLELKTPELKLPKLNLSSVADQLAEIDEKMFKVEAEAQERREAGKAAAPPKREQAVTPEKQKKEKGAEHMGLEEYSKKISEAVFKKDDAQKQTAENTRRLVAVAERQLAAQNEGNRRNPVAVAD